jgi:DNA primase
MISRFRAVRHSKANQRVLFPATGYTTGDLALFYGKMAAVLLPHLSHRPVTLKRFPDDIHGESFWEKDLPAFAPKWIKTFAVPRLNEPSDIHYINIADAKTIVGGADGLRRNTPVPSLLSNVCSVGRCKSLIGK